jgi:hypothetical protein
MGHIHALKILDLITLEGDLRWHPEQLLSPGTKCDDTDCIEGCNSLPMHVQGTG